MVVQFYFLGPFDLRCDEQAILKPPTLKSQSLLAYLVLKRKHPQMREHLINLFWGESPQNKARRSLTTALWHIRKCLPEGEYLHSDYSSVQFNPNENIWVDFDEFNRLIQTNETENLVAGLNLYRGTLLAGFYDDWVMPERYRLEINYTEALARLMLAQQNAGNYREALMTALRLEENDPLREDAYRVSMHAYYQLGQYQAAIQQFQHLFLVLKQELGIEPSQDTHRLYQAILEGSLAIDTKFPIPYVDKFQTGIVMSGSHPLETMSRVKFVGREKELEALEECWQSIRSGHRKFILIKGDAGVGKTRLVEEFINQKRWRGARVLYGRCYEFERMLPYQPVADSLRYILQNLAVSELESLPAWAIKELSRLIPELIDQIPERSAHSQDHREVAQDQLFDAILKFVTSLASRGEVVLVIEDLHWASEATVQLIHYLVRNLEDTVCMVLGTARLKSSDGKQTILEMGDQLERDGLALSIQLAPLTASEVEQLVTNMSGAGAQVLPLAQWLYQESDGNPFFLMESVKALFEGGMLQFDKGIWQGAFQDAQAWNLEIPASISQLIQNRLRRLDKISLETLRLAAVIGREFDFDLLFKTQGQGEELTLTAIDQLLRSRLIEESETPTESDYAFSHHMIHEVVYQTIPTRHKAKMHASVGQNLEEQYLDLPGKISAELAYHYLRSGRQNQHFIDKSIKYSIEAGDQARILYAHQEAIDHYQRALKLLEDERDYERAARILMKVASTYHNAFDYKNVQAVLEDSFKMWQRAIRKQSPQKFAPAEKILRLPWQDPLSLDPNKAFNVYAWGIVRQLFSRLVEFGPDGEIIPDIAKTWEVMEDGKKYVFHLRNDVLWSDGTPLTAEDFEFGWKRLLDPATGWIHASLMYDIKGGRAYHQGEITDPDRIGIYTLDEKTLVVELEEPTGYFLSMLRYVCPVPRHIFMKYGEDWASTEHIVTNGAFLVKYCCRNEAITLVQNPAYYGTRSGNVKEVQLQMVPLQEWAVLLQLYQEDDLDALDLTTFPTKEIDIIRSRFAGEYLTGPDFLSYSLGFNTSMPPFNNQLVRLAFVKAIDKPFMVEAMLNNHVRAARGGFIPPGIPGHSSDINLPYDPDHAKSLLAQAGYLGGKGFPKVHALYLDNPYRNPIYEYLRQQWHEILGVQSTWEVVGWEEYVRRILEDPPQISAMTWLAQYHTDPDDFMKVGMSHARIFTKWENEHYDALVDQARRLTDQAERLKLYNQAERILIDEVALHPLIYGQIDLLVKPSLKQIKLSSLYNWRFKDILVESSPV